ncbi:helix-turn-helix domain-containing protein [Microbacterium sp. No. 7]|uniref:helix-turn-helix domain-containing protein n=1 Tax=Microbacterium sp. No. 7 TaxID=1714373 RepID=UPI0006ED3A31|nr:helix-turn-helix domain-containing protein [Microbacterium sp. No. 7]ALJ22095.1 hypothetical protein AOA12_20280 [Microbacterium sp. No. 7]
MDREVLQRTADLAYDASGMPTVLTDADMVFLAASAHSGGVDANRRVTVMERRVQPGGKMLADDLRFAHREKPFILLPRAAFGMQHRRWCVPIRGNGRALGYVWALQPIPTDADRSDVLHRIGERMQRDAELMSLLGRRPKPTMEPLVHAILLGSSGPDDAPAARQRGNVVVFRPRPGREQASDDDSFERWLNEHRIAWHRVPRAHVAFVREEHLERALTSPRVAGVSPAGMLGTDGAALLGHADFASRMAVASPAPRNVVGQPGGIWQMARLLSEMRHSVAPAIADLGSAAPELVDSALAYMETTASAADLAARLHIHRSTLYYRLSRIERFLGDGWATGSARTENHLGLLLWKLEQIPPISGSSGPGAVDRPFPG